MKPWELYAVFLVVGVAWTMCGSGSLPMRAALPLPTRTWREAHEAEDRE